MCILGEINVNYFFQYKLLFLFLEKDYVAFIYDFFCWLYFLRRQGAGYFLLMFPVGSLAISFYLLYSYYEISVHLVGFPSM